MNSEPVMSAENLGKTYWLYSNNTRRVLGCFLKPERVGATPMKALSGLTFDLYPGEALALIGKNGAGKSTALQLLAGIIKPTEGTYVTRGRVCALLELGSGFNPEFTGRQNIYIAGLLAGLTHGEIATSEQSIIEFAEIGKYIDQPVKFYSSGMFLRLAFAVALAGKPDILIVDEALAVGDIFFRQKCYGRLRELRDQGMAVLLVTHSMGDVLEFCERAILLEQGKQVLLDKSKVVLNRYYHSPKASKNFVPVAAAGENDSDRENSSGAPVDLSWTEEPGTLSFSSNDELSVDGAYIKHIRITDTDGNATRVFIQGQRLRLYMACYTPVDIGSPLCGFAIINTRGVIVHCKGSIQYPHVPPSSVARGSTVIFITEVDLPIECGDYSLSCSFSHMDPQHLGLRTRFGSEVMDPLTCPLSRMTNVAAFSITLPITRKPSILSHYGIVDLPGTQTISIYKKRDYPTIYTIETVLGCNLHCPECAVGGKLIRRSYGYMKYKTFQKIYDKISPHASYMYLHLWGEPMLNPDILSIIKLASRTCKTNISTNANTLNYNTAKQLIDSGVSDIIVSIDGMTQETYAKYRRGGDIKHTLEMLRVMTEHNISSGNKVNIIPQFVVFSHNEHEVDIFASYCHSLGLTATFKAPYLRTNSLLREGNSEKYRRTICHDLSERKKMMKKCPNNNVLTVLLDGSIVACCYDHNGETFFGNILTECLDDILKKQNYTSFFDQLSSGTPSDFCIRNCLMY